MKSKMTLYIDVRIDQLKEELKKMEPKGDQKQKDMIPDSTWYERIIQELEWARQMDR